MMMSPNVTGNIWWHHKWECCDCQIWTNRPKVCTFRRKSQVGSYLQSDAGCFSTFKAILTTVVSSRQLPWTMRANGRHAKRSLHAYCFTVHGGSYVNSRPAQTKAECMTEFSTRLRVMKLCHFCACWTRRLYQYPMDGGCWLFYMVSVRFYTNFTGFINLLTPWYVIFNIWINVITVNINVNILNKPFYNGRQIALSYKSIPDYLVYMFANFYSCVMYFTWRRKQPAFEILCVCVCVCVCVCNKISQWKSTAVY